MTNFAQVIQKKRSLPYKTQAGGGGWQIAKINGPPDFGGWFQILAAHQREILLWVANTGGSWE